MFTPAALNLTRLAFKLAVCVALVAPVAVVALSPSTVWAGDDEDSSESDEDREDREEDERDEAEDRDEDARDEAEDRDEDARDEIEDREEDERDEAEDDDPVFGEDDERNGPNGQDDGSDEPGSDRSGGAPRDIAVYYPDGWVERIVSGRYELIDNQSQLVIRRAATREDFSRMNALR